MPCLEAGKADYFPLVGFRMLDESASVADIVLALFMFTPDDSERHIMLWQYLLSSPILNYHR